MQTDEALARLRSSEAELKRLGVQSLYLFGSTARGEATSESDVDLFLCFSITHALCGARSCR
jgi:predicted nucleotidyltransferase